MAGKTTRIDVSLSDVSDPTKPSIKSQFWHEMPESVEEFQNRFTVEIDGDKMVDPVYELLVRSYTIALQAPARKEVVDQWESIPVEERTALILPLENKEGQYTATLPAAQQELLQQRMDEWKLGEKAPRTRVVHVVGDPVKALIDGLKGGTIKLDDERRAEIQEQLNALLGTSTTAVSGGRQRRTA